MFSKKRFIEFPLEKQHKKCSEILKSIYEQLLLGDDCHLNLQHYNELQAWMNSEPVLILSLEEISNRYHKHLKQAQRQHQEHNLLPSVKKGDKKTRVQENSQNALYLDHLRSAHNVGSIIRTAEAFSFGSVHFSKDTPFISNKQVKDASMKAWEWVSCYENASFEHLPKPLIALETTDNAISLYDFIFPTVFTIALGNEEYGCSSDVLKCADIILEIPLVGRKNSLNVANTFAIVASEIQRQKRLK